MRLFHSFGESVIRFKVLLFLYHVEREGEERRVSFFVCVSSAMYARRILRSSQLCTLQRVSYDSTRSRSLFLFRLLLEFIAHIQFHARTLHRSHWLWASSPN